MRNRYKNAYAQIDVQLKRRYDLIPNLVETAQGLHEARKRHASSRHRGRATSLIMPPRKPPPRIPGDSSAVKGLAAAEKRTGWRVEAA